MEKGWKEEAVKLLKELLEVPSVNSKDDEGAPAEYLAAYFQAHGVEASVQRIDEKHANVLAFVEGKDTSRTDVWNGHIDTVPYGDLEKWETDPKKAVEKDERIYARGASDMKSGAAAMVYALTHLSEKPAHSIRFIGSCDEEKNGLGAQYALEQGSCGKYDFLLIGEPTDMKLGTAHKGCLWLKLIVKGKTGHGAYPEKGVNAIHYAYRLADGLIKYVYGFSYPALGTSTAQIDMISGGVAPNMTADTCEAVMDIRMTPGLTTEMILAHAKELLSELQKEAPLLTARFEPLTNRRAFEISDEDADVAALRGLLKGQGYQGENIGIKFFTDASIFAAKEPERRVLLLGPGDPSMAHQPNEYVEIQKYLDCIEVLQKYVQG